MTAHTASCFLHGTYDAALTRCPKCATDALTRRAEKAEAECGRLREQLDEARLFVFAITDKEAASIGVLQSLRRARAALGVVGAEKRDGKAAT